MTIRDKRKEISNPLVYGRKEGTRITKRNTVARETKELIRKRGAIGVR
jgi:hypothetical protein